MAAKRTRKKKTEPGSRGLAAAETRGKVPAAIEELAERITADGGSALASYRDPLGGHWLVLAVLPLDGVQPTPYQRDLSEAHLKRLSAVLDKVGMLLDPIIATREEHGGYWTPNGNHRLAAMKALGAKAITALVVPDREVASKILALNVEKSHNLKEKSLEVIRMARAIAAAGGRKESDLALEFEEPALLTLGPCYEANGRFSGGAYRSPLIRVEAFLDQPIAKALATREKRAEALLALDRTVSEVVAALKERGIQSPYLKPFVVARINPIRFKKESSLSPEELIDKMQKAAARFDTAKVRADQVSAAGGPPEAE
jgi:ParB family chromosome partitioning protein